GADHAAMQPLIKEVADQVLLHLDPPGHSLGFQAGDLQAQHPVEENPLLEYLLQAGDEFGLEFDHGIGGWIFRHRPNCRAARSLMISSAPPPIIMTLTSR